MAAFEVSTTTPEGESSTVVVSISGSMTVQYAGELKTALLTVLDSAEQIRLDVGNVTEVDLAGLQLLCSAHRTSVQLNKQFVFCDGYNEVVKKIGREAGFQRHVGCALDKGKSCIWVGGKH